MFKKLLNKKESKQTSPQHNVSSQQDIEGFVCPLCMKSLPSPEALQNHFDTAHDETNSAPPTNIEKNYKQKEFQSNGSPTITENRDGDVLAMRKEIEDLKKSLQEEKWHSGELKKELEKNGNIDNSITQTDQKPPEEIQDELQMARLQLKGSEESRTLLSSEVHHLQSQLSDVHLQLENITDMKNIIEQKAAELAGNIAAYKARADESDGQKKALEDHIKSLKKQLEDKETFVKNLNTQLDQRPSADDVLVLKQELVSVQTLMDQMTQDREKEKDVLEKEYQFMLKKYADKEEEYKMLQNKLDAAPKTEDIALLQSALNERDSGSSQLSQVIVEKEMELQEMKVESSKLIDEIARLQNSLQTSNKSTNKLEDDLLKLESSKEELVKELEITKEKVHQLTVNLNETEYKYKQSEDELKEKREKLTCLQTSLDERDSKLNQSVLEASSSNKELLDIQEKLLKNEKSLEEKEKELKEVSQQYSEYKTNSQEELHKKEQTYNNIKLQLEKTQSELETKKSEINDLHQQLTDANKQYETETVNNDELQTRLREIESTLEEEKRKLNQSKEKISGLELQLQNNKEDIQRLESERSELFAKIETGEGTEEVINQLKQENVRKSVQLLKKILLYLPNSPSLPLFSIVA